MCGYDSIVFKSEFEVYIQEEVFNTGLELGIVEENPCISDS